MEGEREGSAAKYVRITVEPSTRVQPGLYLSTNEHYEESGEEAAATLLGHLRKSWDDAQSYAVIIANHLMGMVR